MQTSLQGIANKAIEEKEYRFRNLATMFNRLNLEDSWKLLRAKAAPGVDDQTKKQYQENLYENLEDLIGRLKRGAYRAKLVKRTSS